MRDREDTSVFSPFIFSPSLKIGMRSLKVACTKYCEPLLNLARHSIICTAQNETFAGTSQSAHRLDCGCWIPSRVKRCKFFEGVLTGSDVYMPHNQWLQEYIFPGIKRLEREADHSPLCTAEFTNACCYPSTHPKHRDVCVSPYTELRYEGEPKTVYLCEVLKMVQQNHNQ